MLLAFRISVVLAALFLGAHASQACTCVIDSLSERFRRAKAVFIGRGVAEDATRDRSLIQNYSNDDIYAQTLEVVRGFKGTHEKLIYISFDVEGLKNAGMCPMLYQFVENREYLVFAYGEDYEVQTVCSDTREIPADKKSWGYESRQDDIKKLGSFWFRLRARLNPF